MVLSPCRGMHFVICGGAGSLGGVVLRCRRSLAASLVIFATRDTLTLKQHEFGMMLVVFSQAFGERSLASNAVLSSTQSGTHGAGSSVMSFSTALTASANIHEPYRKVLARECELL